MDVVIIKNLVKKYNKRVVLNIEDLSFKIGHTYLLTGSNGSGKSTLVKSILGLINYDGNILINTKKIGYVPERFPEISLINNKLFLELLSIKNNNNKINELANYFNLDLRKNIQNLSKGNLQKIMIIQSLINEPNLLIFDEPLNGLDPIMQKKFIDLINMNKKNKCIIITTHYLKFYKGMYDDIIYLNNGVLYEYK